MSDWQQVVVTLVGLLSAYRLGVLNERDKHDATPTTAAPSGECAHLWSDWSAPRPLGDSYATWDHRPTYITQLQERSCLHCKLVQRSLI